MSRKVTYLYNEDITKFEFSKEHFMKPRRIKMVHSLINSFGLTSSLTEFKTKEATIQELQAFHHPYYLKYLQSWVIPNTSTLHLENINQYKSQFRKDLYVGSIFKVNQIMDCPGFEGLLHFSKLAAGGSIDAAHSVVSGMGDLVVNWAGGYHHAKKSQSSGFCYVNDIVLCILELLKIYPRVLYLDIDVHHGDGVEQAFYQSNRVMTVSFHQHEQHFFPQTGALQDVGKGKGKYFTVNVPLKKGIDDITYFELFKKVMIRTMSSFDPDVLVIQCGADSLSKDRLGDLNLSIKGHGQCLQFMKQFNIPTIFLGGGGYTVENVARCWTYETGLLMDINIGDRIPSSDQFYYYYMKDDRIHFDIQPQDNINSSSELDNIVQTITENLRESQIRPSVSFHQSPPLLSRYYE